MYGVAGGVHTKGEPEHHDSGASHSPSSQGRTGLSSAGSRLTTSSPVEKPWAGGVQGGRGAVLLGDVCSASSRRKRRLSSVSGLGLARLGMDLATGWKLRLGVGSVRRRATGGVERVSYQRLGEELGVDLHFWNSSAVNLGRLAASTSRMPLRRSSVEILMFNSASVAMTVPRRTRLSPAGSGGKVDGCRGGGIYKEVVLKKAAIIEIFRNGSKRSGRHCEHCHTHVTRL